MKKNTVSDNNQNNKIQYNMKKIKAISFFSFIAVILLLLFCMSAFVPKNWIVAGGSTSVDPIMTELSPWYKKNYKVDFIYNSMGSAAAPVGVQNGYYDMGFESKIINPIPSNAVSFTIAQDYFIILFNLPNGITANNPNDPEVIQLPQNDENHKQLGKIMGDIYAGETFIQFDNDVNSTSGYHPLSIKDQSMGKEKISTFTRESGSGTRDYMENNIIGNGAGSTSNASVESSNGGMMNAIQSSKGSMGYLSFSYINQILEDKLNLTSIGNNLPYKIQNGIPVFNEIYSLKRPFSGIVRTNSPTLKTCLEFINRILYSPIMSNEYSVQTQIAKNPISKIIYDLGFEPASYDIRSYGGDTSGYNPNGADSPIQKLMIDNGIHTEKIPFK